MTVRELRETAAIIRRHCEGREDQFPACLRYAAELDSEALRLAHRQQRDSRLRVNGGAFRPEGRS